jgi:hypothetical protein
LELKTLKIRSGTTRKKKGGWRLGAFIATTITEAGIIRKTAFVNHIFMKAVIINQLPRLMA